MTSKLEQLRNLSQELSQIRLELAAINHEMKNHPLKPTGGATPEPPSEAYTKARAKLTKERDSLKDELAEGEAKRHELTLYLKGDPLPMSSFRSMINVLVDLETQMRDGDVEGGLDGLSRLIDIWEADEARVDSLTNKRERK